MIERLDNQNLLYQKGDFLCLEKANIQLKKLKILR